MHPNSRNGFKKGHKACGGFYKGHPNYMIKQSLETREKMRLFRTGKKASLETRKKISESRMGEKNPMWKNNATERNYGIRNTEDYRKWRKAVFERDNYTCQLCGFTGKNSYQEIVIHADHIQPLAYFPEFRFELSNGRTLCVWCHRQTDTWGFHKQEVLI